MKKRLAILGLTTILLSSCDGFNLFLSGRNNSTSSSSNMNSTDNLLATSSVRVEEERVYYAPADKVEFNIEINSERMLLDFEDINAKRFYQVFQVNANDEYIKNNYKILYYTREEPVTSSLLDDISYSNLYLDMINGELSVNRHYNVFKNFNGDTALSYYKELILIPARWVHYLNNELTVNVTKVYLDDTETNKVSLSSLLPWINGLNKEDIKRVEYEQYYIGVAPGSRYDCYYSEDEVAIDSVYYFLKSAVMRESNSEIPAGGGGLKLTIKTQNEEYTLRCDNSIYHINSKQYNCVSDVVGDIIKKINNFYGNKFVNYMDNDPLYCEDELLEKIPNLFDKLIFKKSETSNVIDITKDLYIASMWGDIYIVDEKHFSLIDLEKGYYQLYEIVGDYDFSTYIQKYRDRENYTTLSIYEGDEIVISVKCDKNDVIEANWLRSILNEYYDTVIDIFMDKDGNVLTQINLNEDMNLYINRDFLKDLNVQYIKTGSETTEENGIIIKSIEELYFFYLNNKDRYDFDGEDILNDTISFREAIDKYDESYFTNNSLIILAIWEGSGSNRHEVKSCGVIDGKLRVNVNRLIPAYGDTDIALWHLIVEIPRDIVEDVFDVEIVIEEIRVEPDYE